MKKLFILVLLVCVASWLNASHLRCGYITVERTDCTSKKVSITITVFTNTSSEVKFGEDGLLYFGDGKKIIVPRVDNIPRPDLGPNIGMASYTHVYTYATYNNYLISYVEPNRNGGVLNMTDSFFTTFYTETRINLAAEICATPAFIASPIFPGFTDRNFSVSLGAASGDQLITYKMVTPYRDRGQPVTGYKQPPNMTLNGLTGLLSWMTESMNPGEYNFAVQATQWTNVDGLLTQTGWTRIDFQVILTTDPLYTPILTDNHEHDAYSRILVKPGEEKQIELTFENGNNQYAILEVFSELSTESFSFTTTDVDGLAGEVKTGLLTLTPQASDVRENAYLVTVRGRTTQGNQLSVSDINYLVYTDVIPDFSVILDPVTKAENDIAQIKIFPNPVSERLTIEINHPGTSEVSLYTLHGTLIKSKNFESRTELVLQDLAPGVYICDVRRNNIPVRKIKLIKH